MTETRKKWKELLIHAKRCLNGSQWPLHGEQSYSPFFIVGSGRCGTTLLRRILQANPEIHIPPEIYNFGELVGLFRRYRNQMSWAKLVHLVLSHYEYQPEFEAFEISLRPLAIQLAATPPESRNLAFVLNALYRYHGEQTGQSFSRWGDKTTLNVFCMNDILAVFPDARFVHLIRDGGDVVSSFLKTGLQPDIALAGERWKNAVRAVQAFAQGNPAACYALRYEEMVADPSAVIQRLCKFLGIRFDETMIGALGHTKTMGDITLYDHHALALKPVTLDRIGKGRDALTQDQRVQLQGILGPDLEQLGYARLI